MIRILRGLAEDWEKAVLWSVVLAFAGLGIAVWHSPLRNEGRSPGSAGAVRFSALGPNALSFLRWPSDQAGADGNAFAFGYRVEPRSTTTVAEGETAGTPPPPHPAWPSEEQVLHGLEPEAEAETEAKAPLLGRIRYLGLYVSTAGERLAAIEVHDPATGRGEIGFWHNGQDCAGFRLAGFDGDSLKLLAPGDGRIRVCRGSQRDVVLGSAAPRAE